ncbi:MAG: glutamate-5-semialdehyde dehydrogenase [Flavobacteriaceae bacterium]|nr:glutamate-5-semialdehyde dehydrogenase [Flavobacteriaceae bacterium]
MNKNLTSNQKNAVLKSMVRLISQNREAILKANRIDVKIFAEDDKAMYDRLIVNDAKIEEMIESLEQLASQEDPVGKEIFHFTHKNNLKITNKTAAFGTVMIIYESRPDVTVEAGGIAFKAGNKILLKGGKEAINSNIAIVDLWHRALEENDISRNWVEYLNYNRQETQEFLKNPTQKIDLIVPRGGEKLIAFVKENATCPVIVSGRGNNFVYVHTEADLDKAIDIIINAKTAKISACNALDKVLIDSNLLNFDSFMNKLILKLKEHKVEILGDEIVAEFEGVKAISSERTWYEEFLDHKILIAMVSSMDVAIVKIDKYSGGHSASIITENKEVANEFLESVDSAAVYHNASTRFTDGFQFGLGGELAISTDKLHHRGPMGMQHLVTNKWYILGDGQIR